MERQPQVRNTQPWFQKEKGKDGYMKKTIQFTICCICSAQIAYAADWAPRLQYDAPGSKFSSNELLVDIFGLHASRERDHFRGDTFGVGAGVSYFFTRNFGAGAETYLDEFHLPRHLDFDFIARYPLERISLAPYVITGFGRQFADGTQWTGHIGGGVDFRLNRRTGVFTDIRHVFTESSKDVSLWRFGLRVRL